MMRAQITVNVGDEFRPNEICLKFGVYRVKHAPAHAPDHEVTCIKGRTFPPCRICGNARFILVNPAPRLESQEFFRGVVTGSFDAPIRPADDKANRLLSRYHR